MTARAYLRAAASRPTDPHPNITCAHKLLRTQRSIHTYPTIVPAVAEEFFADALSIGTGEVESVIASYNASWGKGRKMIEGRVRRRGKKRGILS